MPDLFAVGQPDGEEASSDRRIGLHAVEGQRAVPREPDVRQGNVDVLAVGRGAPLNATERATAADAGAPEHPPAIVGIQGVHDG